MMMGWRAISSGIMVVVVVGQFGLMDIESAKERQMPLWPIIQAPNSIYLSGHSSSSSSTTTSVANATGRWIYIYIHHRNTTARHKTYSAPTNMRDPSAKTSRSQIYSRENNCPFATKAYIVCSRCTCYSMTVICGKSV